MGIMIIMAPEKIPADPRPAIALPKMKICEVGAAPQRAEPTSKITSDVKKTLVAMLACAQYISRLVIHESSLVTYHFML